MPPGIGRVLAGTRANPHQGSRYTRWASVDW